MDDSDILAVTSGHAERVLVDGERILEQGVRAGTLFVLVSGTLEVQRRGRAVVQMSEPGSVVGEMGLLLDSPATADVIAVGPTVVRVIDDAEAFFVAYPDFGRYLATTLAQKLWQVSTYLSDLQEQFADRGDILGLVPTVLSGLLGSTRERPDPGSDREPDSPY